MDNIDNTNVRCISIELIDEIEICNDNNNDICSDERLKEWDT